MFNVQRSSFNVRPPIPMTSAPSPRFPSIKPSEVRHIDLTRSLPCLNSSLTPSAEDAATFMTPGAWLFTTFLLIHAALLLACYLAP